MQADDLGAGEHRGQSLLVLGVDLREDPPVLMLHHFHEEELRTGGSLADGFGLPVFDGFDVEDVVAVLGFGDRGGIHHAIFVHEAHLAVVGMPGARGVESQDKKPGELLHGWVRVGVVIEGITLRPPGQGTVVQGQLLIAGLVGALRRRFGLAGTGVWVLIRLVVGVGVVFAFHSPAIMTANPATHHYPNPPQSRKSNTAKLRRAAA